jgi:excisionase family DNA binding protein
MDKPNRQADTNIQTETKGFLTSQELAALLAVSLRTIVNLRRRRVLPHIKIGRLVRFSRAQVEAVLKDYTIDGI